MALLAEEIVEEWLNRKGYFTIRGIKLGVHEVDILALKLDDDEVICKHVEVQASMRPISYISRVPKAIQNKTGRAAMSAKKRSIEELEIGVKEWIDKKFYLDKKQRLRQALYQGKWEFEFVVHQVKHPEELELIKTNGIIVHRLSDVVLDLEKSDSIIASASGAPLVDLVLLKRSLNENDGDAGYRFAEADAGRSDRINCRFYPAPLSSEPLGAYTQSSTFTWIQCCHE